MIRLLWKSAWTIIGLLLILAMARAAFAAEITTLNCDRDHRSMNCTVSRFNVPVGPRVIHVPQDLSPDTEARIRAWEDFCKPTVEVDRYGVERLQYAHKGCEFGRTQ